VASFLVVVGLASCNPNTTQGSSSSQSPVRTEIRFEVLAGSPNCRLPMATAVKGDGGFLDFGSASFETDPRSVGSWDRAIRVWVPAQQQAISPSGDAYAYVQNRGIVESVVVQTLKPVHSYEVFSGGGLSIIGFTREGVYVWQLGVDTNRLWLAGPHRSSPMLVDAESKNEVYWLRVGEGVVWGRRINADPTGVETLVALNLATGEKTDWFGAQAATLNVLGLARDGVPVVAAFSNVGVRLIEVEARSAVKEIASFSSNPGFTSAHSDEYGTWFASGAGVWLFNGFEFTKVAIVQRSGTGTGTGTLPAPVQLDVAGSCEG